MKRWLKFNAVGFAGAAVQLAVLTLLVRFQTQYLVSTAIAVETAILHNYFWHLRWTWADTSPLPFSRDTFWRFQLANGLVSLTSNLILMRVFAGEFGWGPLAANCAAISLTSVANFTLGDRWVFVARR